jgi:tRNA A-37 threonylcarbamoyl transferase component Bud32
VLGLDFSALIETYPLDQLEMGVLVPIESVVFLGVQEQRTWREHARRWLLPRAVELEALDAAMLGSLRLQYEAHRAGEVPKIAQGPLQRVRNFGKSSGDISLVNDVLGAQASFVAKVRTQQPPKLWDAPDLPLLIELRMQGGRTTDDVFIVANTVMLPQPTRFVRWNPRAALPYSILLILISLPFIRGWGTLVVVLDYEVKKGSKGFFSIQLSTNPGKAKKEKEKKGTTTKTARYQRRVRAWSRFARHMVDRETRFRMMPARTYYVGVLGLLQDSGSDEVIGNYLEERTVKIVRGETTTLNFDFRPKEAPLEVRLYRADGEEQAQVLVALRGVADSLRFINDDSTVFYLGNGTHHVVVGVEGRVYERPQFQLGNPEDVVFSNCPDAVEPYLQGDVEAACRALDRAGQTEISKTILARHYEKRGETGKAADLYEAAGNLTMAAELSAASDDDDQHSATLFEKAGDFHRAGDQYAGAGEHLKAAQAYETAYDYDKAIDAYREAGESAKVLELLERTGRYYEAGGIALAEGDADRAIRNLQMVDLRDPDYAEACGSLADLFAERGEWALAVEKAQDAIEAAGGDEGAPLETHERYAGFLEQAGYLDRALAVYEGIRKRDFQYPNVAERIQSLRDIVEAAETNLATASAEHANTEPLTPMPTQAPAQDRYEILEEIGRGGMGVVFKAKDLRLGRTVALKRLPDNLRDHPTAVQLFLREARAAAALNHPNIVTLFDADQDEGNYYITMEFLEGLGLDAILKKRKRLTVKDALRLTTQIVTGLQYAHEQRIVHRDIKTSNLFFTRERVVKIMDFGLAKMMEEVRKSTTVIGGTPYYMPPEQAAGESLDHRADLYALGVTLFELLSGTVPFREGDVAYHHRHTPPPDLRTQVPEIPEPLALLVLQLMAKSPDDRPADAAAVRAALDGVLRGSA